MLYNYLKIAVRNLRKSPLYSFINLAGLSIGLSFGLLILLWVRSEWKMDTFHDNHQRLYAVYQRQYQDGRIDAGYYTPGLLADELKRTIPEIEAACGFGFSITTVFRTGDKLVKEEGYAAGKDFFTMFSYPLLQGQPSSALSTPQSLAISKKLAVNLFGSPEQAMGKAVRMADKKDLAVTAVFDDVPDNSSIRFDYIVSWDSFLDDNPWAGNWGNNGPSTYILLRPGADAGAVEKKLTHFLDKYNLEQNDHFRIQLGLQRYSDTYLHSSFDQGRITGGRIENVRLFSIIAIFILLIACINFMNLATARSVGRSREIGVRKVMGAVRRMLVFQFMGEALLTTFLSILVALLLVWLSLPLFNDITQKHIIVPFADPAFWGILAAVLLITGLLSGIYPAFYLSSFNPVYVLRKTFRLTASSVWLRKGLVIFQFTLSIILIAGTIVVSRQIRYLQDKSLGYDRENLIYIPLEGTLTDDYALFKQQALGIPGIRAISRIANNLNYIENSTGGVEWPGKEPGKELLFTYVGVGYDLASTLHLRMLEGRDFSRDYGSDSSGYLLNEKALALIGYKNPIGRPLTFWGKRGTIVGIVKDFHFNSLHASIQPLIMTLDERTPFGNILVRVDAGKTRDVLPRLEQLCRRLNPAFPFTCNFSDEEYRKLYVSDFTVGSLSRYFAFLAVFISCLGLLGSAIYEAGQRTREFSIRKVLGAGGSTIFLLLIRKFLSLVLIAMIIAIPISWYAAVKWLQGFAYRTTIPWWIFLLASLLALLIALLTVSVTTIKASLRLQLKALRAD